jgi:hypothetical protein
MRTSDQVIAVAVQTAVSDSAVLRFGEVTAVNGRLVTVTMDGADIPNVPCLGSYVDPTIGDRAWLLFQGSTLVAVGSNALTGTPAVPTYAYVHQQPTLASTWVVDHGLGWNPNVTVIDSGGTEVNGSIAYTSLTSLTITFTAAGAPVSFAGTAYCS